MSKVLDEDFARRRTHGEALPRPKESLPDEE